MLGGRIVDVGCASVEVASARFDDRDSRERLLRLARMRACSGSSRRVESMSGAASGNWVASGRVPLSFDSGVEDEEPNDGVFKSDSQAFFSSCRL